MTRPDSQLGSDTRAAALLPQLKQLAKRLAKVDQDDADLAALRPVADELAAQTLLTHRDRGVRALVACCLADVLRLYAPTAPYDPARLRAIFAFLFRQLALVADVHGTHFAQHVYVLETLSQVKSAVLLWELEADDLVEQAFELAFETVSPAHGRNVALYWRDLLHALIDESSMLPAAAVQTILTQFTERTHAANPAATALAVEVALSAVDKLQRYVCQFFSDVLVAAAQTVPDDDAENEDGDEAPPAPPPQSRDQPTHVQTAHRVIVQLHKTAPGLLLNVVPLLEEELRTDNVRLRSLATVTLGEMFTDARSQLARAYPSVWRAWLERRNDKQLEVRLLWLDYAVAAYRAQPALCAQMDTALGEKLLDPDEQVRVAVVRGIGRLDLADLAHMGDAVLAKVAERTRDKRPAVRGEAIGVLGKLYRAAAAAAGPENVLNVDATRRIGPLASSVLELVQIDDARLRAQVELALTTQLVPATVADAGARTRLLLLLYSVATPQARICLKALLQRQLTAMQDVRQFLDLCERAQELAQASSRPAAWSEAARDPRGPVGMLTAAQTETLLGKIIPFIAAKLPDARRAEQHLAKVSQAADRQTLRTLRALLDLKNEHGRILRLGRDVLHRLAPLHCADTWVTLIRRVSLTVLGRSSIAPLLQELCNGQSEMALAAEDLVAFVADTCPEMLAADVAQLASLLGSASAADATLPSVLRALAKLAVVSPAAVPRDTELLKHALALATDEQASGETAKLAATLLCHTAPRSSDGACETVRELAESLVSTLGVETELQARATVSRLMVLGALAKHASRDLEECVSDSLTSILVKRILLAPSDSTEKEPDGAWVPWDGLDAVGQAKTRAVATLVMRLVALATGAGEENAAGAVAPYHRAVCRLLFALLDHDGELLADGQSTPAAHRVWLRLSAARQVLKLARVPALETLLTPAQFESLALSLQDPVFQVRETVATTLLKYLEAQRLPRRYAALLVVTAHEPESELRQKTRVALSRLARSSHLVDDQRSPFELVLLDTLWVLAQHPDYGEETADLVSFAAYLDFFLDAVASADNIAFIYFVASQVKTVRSVDMPDSRPLYVLSELCQLLIQERSKSNGWALPVYPGTAAMPRSLFVPLLPSESRAVLKQPYLPAEYVSLRARSGVRARHDA